MVFGDEAVSMVRVDKADIVSAEDLLPWEHGDTESTEKSKTEGVEKAGRNDIIKSSVKETDYGYALSEIPSQTEMERISNEAANNGAVVELSGADGMAGAILVYEDSATPETVRQDILAYYQDGVMPKNAIPDDAAFDDVKFSVEHTTDNTPAVIIDKKILDGVPKSKWVSETKKALAEFSDGIPVDGRLVKVNKITRNEYVASKYSKNLRQYDGVKYADKLNAAGNADEIVLASTNYINEDLKHTRKDNFVQFARGDILLQIGGRQYDAKVIIGFTSGNEMVLYDLVDMKSTDFKLKKSAKSDGQSAKQKPIRTDLTDIDTTISQNTEEVKNSIRGNGRNDTRFSISQDKVDASRIETERPLSLYKITKEEAMRLAKGVASVITDDYNATNRTVYGIRGDDKTFKPGDDVGRSMQTFDEQEPYELDGSCAVGFKYLWYDGSEEDIASVAEAIYLCRIYAYDYYYVVAGTSSEYGNDKGEVIIRDGENEGATVVSLIDESFLPEGITSHDEKFNVDRRDEHETQGKSGGDNLLSGDMGRRAGTGAGEQAGRISETAEASETAGPAGQDARSARRLYGEAVRADGGTEIRRQGRLRCEFVKPEFYTEEMRGIETGNRERGLTTYFFVGDGRMAFRPDIAFRGAVTGNEIYIRADHGKYSPIQINRHELVHRNYNTEASARAREQIGGRLSAEEKQEIINTLYARYNALTGGDAEAVFEEFVCDVLAGMNEYAPQFAETSKAYWNTENSRGAGI